MTKVVGIGAGAAGLSRRALLAKGGKRLTLAEASPWLGGRGMAVPEEGFGLNVGANLLEDSWMLQHSIDQGWSTCGSSWRCSNA